MKKQKNVEILYLLESSETYADLLLNGIGAQLNFSIFFLLKINGNRKIVFSSHYVNQPRGEKEFKEKQNSQNFTMSENCKKKSVVFFSPF